MRIAKYLAHAGLGSRRDCEILVTSGQVRINDVVDTNVARTIDPAVDIVFVYNKKVSLPNEYIYVLLNKPSGYLSTAEERSGRKNIFSLLPDEVRTKRRLSIVGRLDRESEGLLLVTDDGELANKLMHPRYEKEKEYTVHVRGEVHQNDVQQLETGVTILVDDQPYKTAPCTVRVQLSTPKKSILTFTLSEGKKRQIRLMCAEVGHPVTYLQRTKIGPLVLGTLPLGSWRYVTDEEKTLLQQL